MGFMAGFGTEFARQIEMGQERRAQQKADAFKLKYADYISQRDTFAELKREDAKAVKRAEAIAERTGVDRKAIPWIAAQIKGGADDSTIETSVITGKFDFSQQGGKPKVEMDRQMVDSGMAPAETPEVPEAPQAPQPASNTELLHANPKNPATKVKLSDKLRELGSGIEQRRQQRLDEYSTNEVAANAGVSPEEVQSTLDGSGYESSIDTDTSGIKFTPALPERKADPFADVFDNNVELAQAREAYKTDPTEQNKARLDKALIRDEGISRALTQKSLAEGTSSGVVVVVDPITKVGKTYPLIAGQDGKYLDENGKPLENGRVITLQEQKDLMDIKSSNDMPKYIDAIANTSDLTRNFKLAYDIAQKTPTVMTTAVPVVATTLKKIAAEGLAIADYMEQNGFDSGAEKIDDLINQYDNQAKENPNDLVAKTSLYQAINLKLAYTLAAMEGQRGNSASNKDVANFTAMIDGAVDPETYRQKLANLIGGHISELEAKGQLLEQYNDSINGFKNAHAWAPGSNVPDPRDIIANSKDPLVKEGYKLISQETKSTNGLLPGEVAKTKSSEESTVKVPKRAIEYLRQNPATRGAFEQMYPGVDVDAILNGGQ